MQVHRPAWPEETSEWTLTVIGGPWAGTRLAWDRAGMVLGREAVGAAVFRGDRAVSRQHAVLRVVDGNCVVEDSGSTNGTFINDVPVDRPTVLGPEDELRIGSTRLRLAPDLGGTAHLDAVPAETGDGPWDGMASGRPTEPQYEAATGTGTLTPYGRWRRRSTVPPPGPRVSAGTGATPPAGRCPAGTGGACPPRPRR